MYQPDAKLVHVTPAIAACAATSAVEANEDAGLRHVPPNALHVSVQLSAELCRNHNGAALGVPEGDAPCVMLPVGVVELVFVLVGVAVFEGVRELERVPDAVMLLLAVPDGWAPVVMLGVAL